MDHGVSVTTAVVLVGGRGTRMWPLTATLPKALLPVAGTPFVELQLAALGRAGVENVFLAVGREQEDAWQRWLSTTALPVAVSIAFEDEPLDTAGGVRMILDQLGDTFLVANGDVMFDVPVSTLLRAAHPDRNTLALVSVEDPSEYGVALTDADGCVEAFVEKPSREEAPARTVSAGMYVLTRGALMSWPNGPLSFERQVFPALVAERLLDGVEVEGRWLDIGMPALYLQAHAAIIDGPAGSVAAGASIDGDLVGEWNHIDERVVLEPGSTVSNSVILSGARIASGASVHDSVIGWDAEIHGTVSGNSVVGESGFVGHGCELDYGIRVAPGTHLASGAVSFRPPPL